MLKIQIKLSLFKKDVIYPVSIFFITCFYLVWLYVLYDMKRRDCFVPWNYGLAVGRDTFGTHYQFYAIIIIIYASLRWPMFWLSHTQRDKLKLKQLLKLKPVLVYDASSPQSPVACNITNDVEVLTVAKLNVHPRQIIPQGDRKAGSGSTPSALGWGKIKIQCGLCRHAVLQPEDMAE